MADKEWTVLARRVLVRQGLADLDRRGMAGTGEARLGSADKAWTGLAWRDEARRGAVWQGLADKDRKGEVRRVGVRQTRIGKACTGMVRRGKAGCGRLGMDRLG